MQHAWERCEMSIKLWPENLKGRVHVEDLGVDGEIVIECILEEEGGKLWTGLIWLRIETSGGLL
jgi:hypothetical protein